MTDPTIAPECTCPWTERTDTWSQPESWTYYFEAQEYDPQCPEHGGLPLLEAPAPAFNRTDDCPCGAGFEHGPHDGWDAVPLTDGAKS